MVPGWVEWRVVLCGGFLVGSLLAAADCLPKVGAFLRGFFLFLQPYMHE